MRVEISFEFSKSGSSFQRNKIIGFKSICDNLRKLLLLTSVCGITSFLFFREASREGKGKREGGEKAKRYEEGNNKFSTQFSSIFFPPSGDTKSRLSPGRAALKGFLNKPITIRGGVIINEAAAGKAR